MKKAITNWIGYWRYQRARHDYQVGHVRTLYLPQPPLGFVARTDPNFYFFCKR